MKYGIIILLAVMLSSCAAIPLPVAVSSSAASGTVSVAAVEASNHLQMPNGFTNVRDIPQHDPLRLQDDYISLEDYQTAEAIENYEFKAKYFKPPTPRLDQIILYQKPKK